MGQGDPGPEGEEPHAEDENTAHAAACGTDEESAYLRAEETIVEPSRPSAVAPEMAATAALVAPEADRPHAEARLPEADDEEDEDERGPLQVHLGDYMRLVGMRSATEVGGCARRASISMLSVPDAPGRVSVTMRDKVGKRKAGSTPKVKPKQLVSEAEWQRVALKPARTLTTPPPRTAEERREATIEDAQEAVFERMICEEAERIHHTQAQLNAQAEHPSTAEASDKVPGDSETLDHDDLYEWLRRHCPEAELPAHMWDDPVDAGDGEGDGDSREQGGQATPSNDDTAGGAWDSGDCVTSSSLQDCRSMLIGARDMYNSARESGDEERARLAADWMVSTSALILRAAAGENIGSEHFQELRLRHLGLAPGQHRRRDGTIYTSVSPEPAGGGCPSAPSWSSEAVGASQPEADHHQVSAAGPAAHSGEFSDPSWILFRRRCLVRGLPAVSHMPARRLEAAQARPHWSRRGHGSRPPVTRSTRRTRTVTRHPSQRRRRLAPLLLMRSQQRR